MSSRMANDPREEGWVPPRTAAGVHWPKSAGALASIDWKAVAKEFIVRNPAAALGAALAAGVVLGWLIKRR